MNYFTECKTLDEAKNLFKRLCFKLHPDTSGYGSQADFVRMQTEFKSVANQLKFKTGFEADKDFNADHFYNNVKKFDGLEDIKISFVGSFVWLEDLKRGAMYEQKDKIKKIGLNGYNPARWARKKISWYFSPVDYSQKSKSGKTLDQLKSQYKTKEFKTRQTVRLNA